ncbi:MAG: flagellar biosynthesis protein FlhA [Spirochaetales bacterium]|nr:flagellar biosynthesis protein FlhA [Spirochaetales bacterium]
MNTKNLSLKKLLLENGNNFVVAVGLLFIISMLLIPPVGLILDIAMILNFLLALSILLIILFSDRALDFSAFPSVLLVSTVFGLAINVSSTRLILEGKENFDSRVVAMFADFVIKGGSSDISNSQSLVIGFIIFLIIVAVQFFVITKGATRVAEVAARFTLDAMPGKQMSIDQEFSSGLISEEDARRKKKELQKEVDFYGAMDGASKFVSGNVKVGIFITAVNIIGGIVIGMLIHGERFGGAASNYLGLAIGDGLVSQFPALLISTATGLIVTRSISDETFGQDIKKQFTMNAIVYYVIAVFTFVFMFIPGAPWYILAPLTVLSGYLGYKISNTKATEKKRSEEKKAASSVVKEPEELSPVVPLDPISVELGYGLIPLVDKDQGAELLDRITRVRRESALELGLVVPRIRIIDNMRLDPTAYSIKINGIDVGSGLIKTGYYLAINSGIVSEEVTGEETVDPAFGLPARWVLEDQRDEADRKGYTVVDGPSIIVTHLSEIIKKHAFEMVGRQDVMSILDTLKQDAPAVVDEVKKHLSLGEIQKVLQLLLKENISIRNIVPILETIADYATVTKDVEFLVEKVRQRLKRQICKQYADDKMLNVLTIDPELERLILDSEIETTSGRTCGLPPRILSKFINKLTNMVYTVSQQGFPAIILTSEGTRRLVRSITEREIPGLIIISVPEIDPSVRVNRLGEIKLEEEVLNV